ncbi:MAG: hypothetical protein GX755_04345 [Syntrophomonadaceae bacterium]|nr:hypothetical protein [Syntrophomonadaceae bacterium]
MEQYQASILVGVTVGFLARLYLLKVDYRQYPSYPHGYVTHISFGFIAAAIGAVAIPAIMKPDFTAVTFLALAATQFREVRRMERETLGKLDESELVPRGNDYIEGIARVFEARNYLVMAVAMVSSLVTYLVDWPYGVAAGVIAQIIAIKLMSGEVVGDIAEVIPSQPVFNGALLTVGGIVIMNIGLPEHREKVLKEGLSALIKPKDDNARATLDNLGQRQAILHVAAALLGSKREIGEWEFAPLIRKDINTGVLAIFLLPIEPDMECLIEAINRVPVLESSKRRPLASRVGRQAAD